MSDPVYPSSLSAMTLLSRVSSTVTPSRHSFSSAERVSSVSDMQTFIYTTVLQCNFLQSYAKSAGVIFIILYKITNPHAAESFLRN
jgi:hypothetical protein